MEERLMLNLSGIDVQAANETPSAITIGGVSRSEGGKLIGYGVPGKYIMYPGFSGIYPWPWNPPKLVKPKYTKMMVNVMGEYYCDECRTRGMVYGVLHERHFTDKEGSCDYCGKKYLFWR